MKPIRFEFVPLGSVMEAAAGVIAVDVGSKCIPGVIDHHFADAGDECAASLVVKKPELVLDHLSETGRLKAVVMHREPDLDCVVSAYLVMRLAADHMLPAGAEALAEYTRLVDSGLVLRGDSLGTSLWGLYTAAMHLQAADPDAEGDRQYEAWVRRGFELVECAFEARPRQASEVMVSLDSTCGDRERQFVETDARRYDDDRERSQSLEIELPVPVGDTERVKGLVTTAPSASLFKHFARSDGNVFTHVVYPGVVTTSRGDQADRHVISVAPESGVWLKGLGSVLEAEELAMRARTGAVRNGLPRWPDVTCDDPWYDGRSPLHRYTIVDSPRDGTVLDVERVQKIAKDTESWIPVGAADTRPFCPLCQERKSDVARFCPSDGQALVPGVIAGRYEVEGQVGEGGMGSVYVVVDIQTGERYALKVMHEDRNRDSSAPRRFFREALIGNRLNHPGLMRVVDVGADARTGLYMVCEYLQGMTLRLALARLALKEQRMPRGRVRAIATQICDALEALHDAGVVHRDLKPDNIMLLDTGDEDAPIVKIMDFGIAFAMVPGVERLTTVGKSVGTPMYAAPEQLMGEGSITARSDLYAFGCILYEMITGAAPFADSESLTELVTRKLWVSPISISEAEPQLDVDQPFDAVLRRTLSQRSDERPESVNVLRDAICSAPFLQ